MEKLSLQEYVSAYKKIKELRLRLHDSYISLYKLKGNVIHSSEHPFYFLIDQEVDKIITKLDAPFIAEAKYQIGDTVVFTRYYDKEKTEITGVIKNMHMSHNGNGEIIYGFHYEPDLLYPMTQECNPHCSEKDIIKKIEKELKPKSIEEKESKWCEEDKEFLSSNRLKTEEESNKAQNENQKKLINKILYLKIGEQCTIENTLYTRVPGGWAVSIEHERGEENYFTTVFVPWTQKDLIAIN